MLDTLHLWGMEHTCRQKTGLLIFLGSLKNNSTTFFLNLNVTTWHLTVPPLLTQHVNLEMNPHTAFLLPLRWWEITFPASNSTDTRVCFSLCVCGSVLGHRDGCSAGKVCSFLLHYLSKKRSLPRVWHACSVLTKTVHIEKCAYELITTVVKWSLPNVAFGLKITRIWQAI